MRPQGGVEKISMATGQVEWATTRAAKPLAVHDDLLIAQAERADVAGLLEIVLLDLKAGGELRSALPIALPAGVRGLVDEQMDRALVVRASVAGSEPRVAWEYTERDVRGIFQPTALAVERKQAAEYRIDVPAGRAVAVEPAATVTNPLPANVAAWETSDEAGIAVSRVDGLLAATRVRREAGSTRITLKRWEALNGAELPEIELFDRPHVLQFVSADGRHLLVTERANAGEFREYEWSIFSLATGEKLGQVSHHLSHARFFVAGPALIFVEPPYGRRVGEEWFEEPLKVKAVLLGSAFSVWERPLRDTTYRGPFPP